MSASLEGGVPVGTFDLSGMQAGLAAAGGGAPGGDGGDERRGGDVGMSDESEESSEGSESSSEEEKKRETAGKMNIPYTNSSKKPSLHLVRLIPLLHQRFNVLSLLSIIQLASN